MIRSAALGGLFIGVLSALPIVGAANCCCCLWIVSGGALASYLEVQQKNRTLTGGEGAAVYGDRGYIILGNTRWRAYGPGGKLLREGSGDSHEGPHVQNFIDCIKSRRRPYCDLETIGHPASILCHAGNISARLGGRKLRLDPKTEMFIDDREANALRSRPEYRKPWVLPEVEG